MRKERKKAGKKAKRKLEASDVNLTDEAVVVVETTAVLTATKEAKVSCLIVTLVLSWIMVITV